MSTLQWSYSATPTVAVTGDVTITIDRPVHLTCLTLAKVSGGNVTALTVARSLDGGTSYGPARTVTLAAALTAANDAVDVDLVDECPTHVKFGVTVSASTVVRITGRAFS